MRALPVTGSALMEAVIALPFLSARVTRAGPMILIVTRITIATARVTMTLISTVTTQSVIVPSSSVVAPTPTTGRAAAIARLLVTFAHTRCRTTTIVNITTDPPTNRGRAMLAAVARVHG